MLDAARTQDKNTGGRWGPWLQRRMRAHVWNRHRHLSVPFGPGLQAVMQPALDMPTIHDKDIPWLFYRDLNPVSPTAG